MDISDYVQKSFEKYKKYYESNISLYKTTTKPNIKLLELENYQFPFKNNTVQTIEFKFYALNTLSSKIEPGNKIGCITIYYQGKILSSIDIILENKLLQNSWQYYFYNIFKNLKSYMI